MFELKTDFDFCLTVESSLRGQGIDPARAKERLIKAAQEALEEAPSLLAPAALYGTLPVLDFQHERVEFAGGCFEGPLVARAMAGASEINLALCTIGSRLEERVAGLMGEDAIIALALDGAGTAAIREVSLSTAVILIERAESRGLKTGMIANPGQEGWPIEQQQLVFDLIPAEKINVRLTDSCLMLPRKSVTFAFAAGEEMRNDAVPCDFCSKRERCRWRREKAMWK